MSVVSGTFLVTALATAAAIRLAGASVSRETLLIGASVAFILAAARDPACTVPFWIFVLGGFVLVRNAHRAARPLALACLVVLVVGCWRLLRAAVPAAAPGEIATFGLSFAMFRILHLVVDARDDALGGPLTLRSYLCYLTFFPCYLSGPMVRYQQFAPQVSPSAAVPPGPARVEAARRIVAGCFECTVLAGASLSLHAQSLAAMGRATAWGQAPALLSGACLAYAASLYFSLAGYTGVAVGAGRLLGVEIPENFDAPWRARNFLDFWSRWHITVSEWFRFYVFNPLLQAVVSRVDRPAWAPYFGVAGYFVTFFLMGVWHGVAPVFVAYGLFLGLGVSVNKLYQVAAAKALGRRAFGALAERPAYRIAAQALALWTFVLALPLLWIAPSGRVSPSDPVLHAPWLPASGLVLACCVLVTLLAGSSKPGAGELTHSRGMLVTVVLGLATAAYLWLNGGVVPTLIYQQL